MHRSFKPGVVRKVPSEKEIEDLKKKYPDLLIKVNIREGMDLDDMPPHHIDSYSYVLANIFLGAQNTRELLEKYHDVTDNLSIGIDHRKS